MPEMLNAADELELYDYLRIIRRRWRWAVLACLITTSASAAWTATQPPSHCTTAQVLIADSEAQVAVQGNSNVNIANRDLANELSVARSDALTAEVERNLSVSNPDIAIEGETGTDILNFRACHETPEAAAEVANTWSQRYVALKQEQAASAIISAVEGFEQRLSNLRDERSELTRPITAIEDRLAAATSEANRAALDLQRTRLVEAARVELQVIDTQIQTIADTVTVLELDSALARTGTARVIQQAAIPTSSTITRLRRNLVLGVVAGLALGAIAVFIADSLDQSIRSPEDITDVPLLGVIPRAPRGMTAKDLPLATMNHEGSSVAEGYQKIRGSIEFAMLGRPIQSVLITSPNESEGKTTTSCNLAWALSALDHRIVLADVDFRRPRIHAVFGCAPEPGLSDHLLSGAPLNQLALRVDDNRRNMVIIPTGPEPSNPADFVASPHFVGLLKQLEAESDLVVLDAPPVVPVSDSLSIARHVDAVIVVARAGTTSTKRLGATVAALQAVGADILGVCLVGVSEPDDRYGYDSKANGRSRAEAKSSGRGIIDLRVNQQNSRGIGLRR